MIDVNALCIILMHIQRGIKIHKNEECWICGWIMLKIIGLLTFPENLMTDCILLKIWDGIVKIHKK